MSKDVLGIKNLADRIGFGLGDSKVVGQLGENLNLGKVADSLNVNAVAKKITDNSVASVIEYEGDNTTFIWKHPLEDFNTGSQLIVHESQEALFFMNGEALDLFGPGRHTLETQNLPLVGKFFRAPTGGVTPFHCEVYFINKTEQMSVKWGTDSKLEYIDPVYNFPVRIGASGEMSIRADDSRKLLVKLVGTEKTFTHQGLTQKFRAFILTRVKSHLAAQIKRDNVNIFELDEQLEKLSAQLLAVFQPDFSDYGLSLERFFVTTVIKPEEDRTYQRLRELHGRQHVDVAEAKLKQQIGVIEQETMAQRTVIEAQSLAQKRQLEGYTYKDERGFDVAERMAQNEAVGQMGNLGVGLGVMTGVGGAFGGMMRNVMEPALTGQQAQGATTQPTPPPQADTKFCSECGARIPRASKFCSECGAKLGGGQ